MYKEIIDKIKPELDKAIEYLKQEISKIRTSRANPALVEDLKVDCFGQEMLLKQLGSISCPQLNQIVIEPWDKSYVQPIEKAISQSNLGLTPNVSGNIIRLNFPLLTEEHRKNLLRVLSEKSEEVRQTIRHWRTEAWDEIQEAFRENKLGEDEKFRGKDELQKLVDEYNQKVEEIMNRKRKEIEN